MSYDDEPDVVVPCELGSMKGWLDKSEVKRGRGRPSSYTDGTAEVICERLAEGESLISICRDPAMPGIRTVFQWLESSPDFTHKYARAREIQGHVYFDMAGEVAVNAEDAGRGRLAYDARKWQASKLAPKVYGDKTEISHTGPNNGPIQNVVTLDAVEASRAYQRMIAEDK